MKFETRMTEILSEEELPSFELNPSDDYELNTFLAKLADDISKEELKKLKYFIKGNGGSGKGTLEQIEDPLDYFDHLRQKNLLSLDNLCLLQAFIWQLGRKDLYEKFVEFGRQVKRPLYFYTPKETPENGYKYVKFHVVGKVGREKVENVRDNLARLLCVPKEFVIVAGVEASGSLMITFMIPEQCEIVLLHLSGDEKSALLRVGVDQFTLDGNIFLLQASVKAVEENEESLAIHQVLLKEKRLQKELDSCHSELISCRKKMKKMLELQGSQEQNITEMMKFFSLMEIACMLYNQFLLERIEKEKLVPPLKITAARAHFSQLLEKARSPMYDRTLISDLLQVNEFIVKANVTKAYKMKIDQLNLEVSMVNAKVLQLEYINQKLAYIRGQDEKELADLLESEEYWQYVTMRNMLPLIEVKTEFGVALEDTKVHEILYELSTELTAKEKSTIKKSVKLNEYEEDKFRCDQNRLLEIVLAHSRTPGSSDLDTSVYKILEMVDRHDLKSKYHTITEKLRKPNKSKPAASSPSQTMMKRRASRKKKNLSNQNAGQEVKAMAEISTRLQRLENVVTNAIKGSKNPTNPDINDPETMKMLSKLFLSKKYGRNGRSTLYDVE